MLSSHSTSHGPSGAADYIATSQRKVRNTVHLGLGETQSKMASAEYIKALLQSHAEGDNDRFYSIAMQMAAHEARLGHGKLARELRDLIDAAKANRGMLPPPSPNTTRGTISGVLNWNFPKARLGDLIHGGPLAEQIRRVIREHRQASRILEHGLTPRRKLLFVGPHGTGKSFSASVLAGELGLPLLEVQFDGLYARFKDEGSDQLERVFNTATRTRGVYFFVHEDIVGSYQVPSDEVDERDLIVSSLLTMVDRDNSHSIFIVSTSRPETLDVGSVGFFDDVLEYGFPDKVQIARFLETRLRHIAVAETNWTALARLAIGFSFSEVSDAANDALKNAVISGLSVLRDSDINAVLSERKAISERMNAYEKQSE